VASHLSRRLQRAIEFADLKHMWQNGSKTLVVSGGVACNSRIRSTLQKVKVENQPPKNLVCPNMQLL
jgi:tRNA A37 threonylcarbamoyltransferase TsaD